MSLISSEHNLGGFEKDQTTAAKSGRSDYCYLFEEEANRPEAGRFTISAQDDQDTIRRLIAFSVWMENVNSKPDAMPVNLRIKLPACFTYFGQFVNHDLSAPVGSLLGIIEDIPEQSIIGKEPPPGIGKLWRANTTAEIIKRIRNEHALPLTLNSLYGDGPFLPDGRASPSEVRGLYDAEGLQFVLAKAVDASGDIEGQFKNPVERIENAPDLPRKTVGGKLVTKIADQRNDGNLILAQLHLAMMLFHNKAVKALRPKYPVPATCFAAARRLVTHHYHWCILHDFLPRILSEGVIEAALKNRRKVKPELRGKVPMEFTTAAFRFGHSLISAKYDYNSNFGSGRSLQPSASLIDLFTFTSAGGMRGHAQLPDHWVIDWDRLSDDEVENPKPDESHSERIDFLFAHGLEAAVQTAPTSELQSIVARNLVRGFHRRIPFGQELATLCGNTPLRGDDIRKVMPNRLAADPAQPDAPDDPPWREELAEHTPAWLYFLCEAQAYQDGEKLGPTASQIVAKTFVGLIGLNVGGVVDNAGAGWSPADSPLRNGQDKLITTLRDLLLFAVAGEGG